MILILVCSILFVINIIEKRNKKTFLLSLSIMWIIITYITNNADEGIYISHYYNSADWKMSTEILFQLLNTLCNKIGLSFIQYKGVLAFIYITLIGTTVWRLSKYPNFVLILFFFYPFTLNVSQLRFALASAVFVYGYRYLLLDNCDYKVKWINISNNDLKFIITVVIATLIHTVALYWAFLILIKKLTIRKTICFTAALSGFIYFIFNPSLISWILIKIGAYSRMSAYFTAEYQNSAYRHYGMTTIALLLIAMCSIICCCLCRRKNTSSEKINNIEILLKYNIFSLSTLAFIFRYTSEMYRPQEGLLLLNYIQLTNEFPKHTLLKLKGKKTYILLQFLIVMMVIISFFFKVYMYNRQSIWYPIFLNNSLIH